MKLQAVLRSAAWLASATLLLDTIFDYSVEDEVSAG